MDPNKEESTTDFEIEGRAETPEQKRVIIERLYQAWLQVPELRFGQMIVNSTTSGNVFYVEDDELAEKVERFCERFKGA